MSSEEFWQLLKWSTSLTMFLLPTYPQAGEACDVIAYEIWILYIQKPQHYKWTVFKKKTKTSIWNDKKMTEFCVMQNTYFSTFQENISFIYF